MCTRRVSGMVLALVLARLPPNETLRPFPEPLHHSPRSLSLASASALLQLPLVLQYSTVGIAMTLSMRILSTIGANQVSAEAKLQGSSPWYGAFEAVPFFFFSCENV